MEGIPKLREALSWQGAISLLAVYLLTLIFYRLYLDPLSSFPGPKLVAIARYYEAYFDVVKGGQYTFKIADLHKEYGPIVRISPYELHVSDPAFFEKIYRQDGRWDKYAWTYNAFYAAGATICTPSHDRHRARRQPWNPFFSKARVNTRQDVISRNVSKLCARISQLSGETLNLGAAISALTRDVVCEFVLNKTYGSLDSDDFNVAVTDMLPGGGVMWRITKHVQFFTPMLHLIPPSIVFRLANDATRIFLQFVKEGEDDTKHLLRVAAAPSNQDEAQTPRTIVHEILDSKLPPEEKQFTRVHNDVVTITGAGFETTANVLRLVLFHLDLTKLEQLPYLTATLMEGMRLSPAIGSRMARIAPDRDLFYGGLRIPKGTPVGMTGILMHTDEKLYPEPLRFDPERWLDPEAWKGLDKVYAPFSRGTRICIGMHLAWAEMYLTVAHLVQRFDFKFQGAQPEDFEMHTDAFIIGTRRGALLNCIVSPRKA
ncbi:cytochrome P450 [Xylariomycetidae sp. FL2044]|nr:cytochrome P450 [Xylariomycetidae sp. FL2044]